MRLSSFFFLGLMGLAFSAGCQKPVHFPAEGDPRAAADVGALKAFDANLDGRVDFYLFANDEGRIDRLGYDRNAAPGPDHIVRLDAIPPRDCRHLVIILDGFGYGVVRAMYDAGNLRMFHPPSKVVAPYPTLTDMCVEDLLGYIPAPALETVYYSYDEGHIVGGNLDYLDGFNQPYNHLLDYRANLIWDAIGYVEPWEVLGKELNDAKRIFDRRDRREVLAYFVSSAGMSTRYGMEGQRRALRRVERLIHQVLYETHGLAQITLMSDHGHGYTRAERLPVEKYLKEKGWRVRDRLEGPRDVAFPQYGLTTYANFATRSPEALSRDLAALEGVEVTSFVRGDDAIVLGPDGTRARIRRRGDRYAYEAIEGDPLGYLPVLEGLQGKAKTIEGERFYPRDAIFAATVDHHWPDALERLWRAHFTLVEHPPDVIVSLADRYYCGADAFSGLFPIVSTHGGLNNRNSVTFVMTTAGPLPEALRARDVPDAMSELLGRPWPIKDRGR